MREEPASGLPAAQDCVRGDEATLIDAALRGDADAYQELCQCHSKQLFRSVMRILHNMEDAEDVVQESLIKAFINLRLFKQTSRFSTWLTRIAINCALMQLRRRRSGISGLLMFPANPEESFLTDVATGSPSPEDLVSAAEQHRVLRDAISDLPTALREIVASRLQEASIREIATAASLSEPAVKARLHRARSRLRQTIANRNEGAHEPHIEVQPGPTLS